MMRFFKQVFNFLKNKIIYKKVLALFLASLYFCSPLQLFAMSEPDEDISSNFVEGHATEVLMGGSIALTVITLCLVRFFSTSGFGSSSALLCNGNEVGGSPIDQTLKEVKTDPQLGSAAMAAAQNPDYDSAVADIKNDLNLKKECLFKACANHGIWGSAENDEHFLSVWDALKYLLATNKASEEDKVVKYVTANYPEWEKRLSPGGEYNKWVQHESDRCYKYQCMQLLTIAYVLRLAALVNYQAWDPKNGYVAKPDRLEEPELYKINETQSTYTSTVQERLQKVIVENNDILRSMHNFVLNNPAYCQNGKIGALNAGDRRITCGFIAGYGCALEEYLATMTTLAMDTSYKAFIAGQSGSDKSAFYNRGFEAVCGFKDWELNSEGLLTRTRKYLKGDIMPENFYDLLVSRNVRLIRGLGNVQDPRYVQDPSAPWNYPADQNKAASFDPPRNGLGAISFPVVSVGGLEDRYSQMHRGYVSGVLIQHGDKLLDEQNPQLGTIRGKWEEITKRQCELILRAFIKEKVKVPFLCAFGAGCFGGIAAMIAKCWFEVLITMGYIAFFDYVVFPIGYSQTNYQAFAEAFKR